MLFVHQPSNNNNHSNSFTEACRILTNLRTSGKTVFKFEFFFCIFIIDNTHLTTIKFPNHFFISGSVMNSFPLLSNLKKSLYIDTKTAITRFCICRHSKSFLINVYLVLCYTIAYNLVYHRSLVDSAYLSWYSYNMRNHERGCRPHWRNALLIKILELRMWSETNELGEIPSVWRSQCNASCSARFLVLYVIFNEESMFSSRN